jgi:hypothetical protein
MLMSAIMSVRAAASSLETESNWRPLSMGPVVSGEENQLRASFARADRPSQVRATAMGPQPWVSDDERRTCTLCDRKFHPFFRKHHCRMCGIIICSKCSPSRVALPDLGYQNLVRVCTPCFARRDVQDPFDAMTQKFSGGASINVLAVSSASIAPVGLYALPDSDVFPTRAVAGDVRGGQSARSSPSSSPSLGPATPPPARSAFDIVSDAQKRALK